MTAKLSYFRNLKADQLPPILYFDSSFIVNALVAGEFFHAECFDFIDRLAKLSPEEQPVIVFSELLKTELRCAIISICIRKRFGKETKTLDRIRANPELLKEFNPSAEHAEKCLLGIMRRFTHWSCMPINEKINDKASKLMGSYRLGSYDAIHVATMEVWGIKDIVAFDWGIDELPKYMSCFVWTFGQEGRKHKSLEMRENESKVLKITPELPIVIDAQEIIRSESKEDLAEPDQTNK